MNKVINFHGVTDIRWFDLVIIILKNKYNIIGLDELEFCYYEGKTFKNNCHITIDDGDISFYNIIYPVLRKYNIPASIFVSPYISTSNSNFWFQEIQGYDEVKIIRIISDIFKIDEDILSRYSMISIFKNLQIDEIWEIIKTYKKLNNSLAKEAQNMNNDQLIEIDKSGLISIGAHTLNHPILANEDEENSKMEIVNSINELSRILGHEIKCFAYPNGIPSFDFGQREMNILKNTNCKISFSTESKNFTLKDDPLCIPRFGLSYGNEYFVKAKLFLGRNWDKIKDIKSKGEKRMRIELKNIFK